MPPSPVVARIQAAIEATTLPENRLLQLLVCLPTTGLDELARALPDGVRPDDIEPVLASLGRKGLVRRAGGRIECAKGLHETMPTKLGPPLRPLIELQTVDYLRQSIAVLRAEAVGASRQRTLPPGVAGAGGRPPRKAELIAELEELLALPGLVEDVVGGGPAEAVAMARDQADGRPVVPLTHPLYWSSYRAPYTPYYERTAEYWLFQRALLLPFPDGRSAAQPRQVGVALHGGRPIADLEMTEPQLVQRIIAAEVVDADGARRVVRTMDLLAELLERWTIQPAKGLKNGGLGVRTVRDAAGALDVESDEIVRLTELLHLGGLLRSTVTSRFEKRKTVVESYIGPGDAASWWSRCDLPRRWSQLATAWRRAEHWPSAPTAPQDRKPPPVMAAHYAVEAPDLRRIVLDALASMAPGQATTAAALAAAVYWRQPQPWLRVAVPPDTAIGWVLAEAELLGIVSDGALTGFGRCIVDDDAAGAERLLQAVLPEPVRTFTLQADLTAVAVGALDRTTSTELRLMADLESAGAASTYRFSDASLRRALDAGRDAESILAFLDAHAAKGVPKPLRYLVHDVARRHGHLRVGTATSVVVADDPAVLADACSHRRTRKLALRLIAPTVAVSSQPQQVVLDALRLAGFLPTSTEGAGTTEISSAAAPVDRRGATERHGELPEPYRQRPRRRPAHLDHRAASPFDDVSPDPWADVGALLDDDDGWSLLDDDEPGAPDDHSLADVREVLTEAADGGHVLAVASEHLDPGGPLLLHARAWDGMRLAATNLEDGAAMLLTLDQLGAVLDLGPIGELLPDDTSPRRRHRPKPRRP